MVVLNAHFVHLLGFGVRSAMVNNWHHLFFRTFNSSLSLVTNNHHPIEIFKTNWLETDLKFVVVRLIFLLVILASDWLIRKEKTGYPPEDAM